MLVGLCSQVGVAVVLVELYIGGKGAVVLVGLYSQVRGAVVLVGL